jgi:5-methyltetrahydrofolate--homocysteine methyltransferase
MPRFLEALHSGRVLLMDGAMGTELQRAGIREGDCYEGWNLTRPDTVRAIHQAYVDAGARCLVTNTFQANLTALGRHGLHHQLTAINRAAVEIARSVRGPAPFVLGDIGPFEPTSPDTARPLVESLDAADGLLLETCSDLRNLAAVLKVGRIVRPGESLPVLFSLTFRRTSGGELRTADGHRPEAYARKVRDYGIAALGLNCGRDIGMDEVIEIVRRYRQVTDLPLFARPNAGTPTRIGDQWHYPHTPEQMAARLPELLEAGVVLVGGCCGTTPEHIAAFRPVIDDWTARVSGGSQNRGS